MEQNITSANTSINKTKTPAIYKKVDVEDFDVVIDWGCGKFDTGKEYAISKGCGWFGYDPYNRSEEENEVALTMFNNLPSDLFCVVCSNVLNVIDSDEAIEDIAQYIIGTNATYFISVYEGDKSGKWAFTKADCMQRNQRASEYLKFFPGAVIIKGVITNHPEFVK